MVIRASRAGEIERLLGALGDPATRDAAVARLRVIGPRAYQRLARLIDGGAPAAARAAAVLVLDGSDDPRALDLACACLTASEPAVAIAAATVLRGWLPRDAGARALDALTALALDEGRPPEVRHAAREALGDLPADLVAPILAEAPPAPPTHSSTHDDPASARAWLAGAPDAPLPALHAFLVAAHERERTAALPRLAQEWQAVRGAAHARLAARGSTVAVYDLRESFETARQPLPLDFLTAVQTVGDATCLDALGRAWAASPPGDAWWRDQVRRAAGAIVSRLGLSGRQAAVKRVRARYPGLLD